MNSGDQSVQSQELETSTSFQDTINLAQSKWARIDRWETEKTKICKLYYWNTC